MFLTFGKYSNFNSTLSKLTTLKQFIYQHFWDLNQQSFSYHSRFLTTKPHNLVF